MKNLFNLVVFPIVLCTCFVAFADDRGGDRVNNGFVDNGVSEKNNLGGAEGTKKGGELKKKEKCAKDDKECLKKEADQKKKDEAKKN